MIHLVSVINTIIFITLTNDYILFPILLFGPSHIYVYYYIFY